MKSFFFLTYNSESGASAKISRIVAVHTDKQLAEKLQKLSALKANDWIIVSYFTKPEPVWAHKQREGNYAESYLLEVWNFDLWPV